MSKKVHGLQLRDIWSEGNGSYSPGALVHVVQDRLIIKVDMSLAIGLEVVVMLHEVVAIIALELLVLPLKYYCPIPVDDSSV
jgi:hypothetical protein